MTAVESPVLGRIEAERLTDRIRYTAMSVRDGVEKLQQLVTEAQEGQAHLALGYPSWTAYIADVMGEDPLRLRDREERREVVSWLAGQGMSTRAIAPVVGVDQKTVSNDLRSPREENSSPASPAAPDEPTFDPTPSWDPVGEDGVVDLSDPTQDDVLWDAPEPRTVTGMDGKTYPRPEPKEPAKPRRRPLPDQFFDAAYDAGKAIERLERLVGDDRLAKNKEQIALAHKNDLLRLADVLAHVLRELD